MRDRDWIVPATAIVCVEYLVALSMGTSVGFHYTIPFATYAIVGLTIAAIGLSLRAPILLYRYWRADEPNPARRLVGELPYAFAVGVILVSLQIAALNWFKVMLPIASAFTADEAFADLDHLLFGTDPWRLTYAVFGPVTGLIDQLYTTWGMVKFATLLVLLALPASRLKTRALLSYFVIVASGAMGQYLGASAGPVFWPHLGLGDRFAELPVSPWVQGTSAYLWSDYLHGGGKVGGGISAMPSLHVAVALWLALVSRSFVPRFQALGWFYFAVILVGSVHLGWHYAVDGIVAVGLTLAAWRVARLDLPRLVRRGLAPQPT